MASRNRVASCDTSDEIDDQRAPPAGDVKLSGDEKPSDSTEYQLWKYLLLLATLVATVTYVAGLKLPGGTWQDTKDGHTAGDPILRHAHYHRYLMFYYCNATAFAASLVVSLLLLVLNGKNTGWEALLRVVMVLDLLGLMGAYAAGSCRDLFTTIYSAVLVCAVFAYITLAFFAFSFHWGWAMVSSSRKKGEEPKKQVEDTQKQDGKQSKDTKRREREDLREVLMLLATFAVTITYGAGLDPPGGFWDDTQDGQHRVSDPILQEHYPRRYQAFFVCNTTAFVASLLIIILLLDKRLSNQLKNENTQESCISSVLGGLSNDVSVRLFVALHGFIITALLGLIGAYAAGSCREVVDTTSVVCLIGAVAAYIFIPVALKVMGCSQVPANWHCSAVGLHFQSLLHHSKGPNTNLQPFSFSQVPFSRTSTSSILQKCLRVRVSKVQIRFGNFRQ